MGVPTRRIESFINYYVARPIFALLPCRRNVKNIVATDETISILGLKLPINILLGLLHCNVHVTIQTCKDSFELT